MEKQAKALISQAISFSLSEVKALLKKTNEKTRENILDYFDIYTKISYEDDKHLSIISLFSLDRGFMHL